MSAERADSRRASPPAEGAVAGFDPGRSKCGLVCTDPGRQRIVEALVLPSHEALDTLRRWQREQHLALVLLGDGTGHRGWQEQLQAWLPVELSDERGTTLAARQRYWRLEPPRGWRRWLPQGLRLPPRDWDDVVAQLLVERWLGRELPRHQRATVRTAPAP